MNCKQAQDLILSGYLDGLLDKDQVCELSNHLKKCACCKEVLSFSEKMLVEPFENSISVNPPEELWLKIEKRIKLDNCELSENIQLWEFLSRKLQILKPISVAVCVSLIVFIAYFITQTINFRKQREMQARESLKKDVISSFINEYSQQNIKKDINFYTAVEEYFL